VDGVHDLVTAVAPGVPHSESWRDLPAIGTDLMAGLPTVLVPLPWQSPWSR
jgi:hypothetical protein